MVLGMLYNDQHNFTAAERYFREAQKENQHNARANLWLGLSIAEQGKLSEAIKYYRQGLALKPDDGWLNYLMGKALWDMDRKDEAQIYLERSVQYVPSSWESAYLPDALKLLSQLRQP